MSSTRHLGRQGFLPPLGPIFVMEDLPLAGQIQVFLGVRLKESRPLCFFFLARFHGPSKVSQGFLRDMELGFRPVESLTDQWHLFASQRFTVGRRLVLFVGASIAQVGAGDDIKPEKAIQIDLSVEEVLVEKAFEYLNKISEILVMEYNLRP